MPDELIETPGAVDDTTTANEADCTDTESPPQTFTAKQARKMLKSEEERLRKELQRYKDACKKARHTVVVGTVIEDREKVKKAEWMFDSIKHYLKDGDKKALKSDVSLLSPTYHQSAEQSIEDLKTARRRIKTLLKSTGDPDIDSATNAPDTAD